ncbi:hemagglutinin-related protein [Photorhabdus temperata subsp. temperata M1021]|nr:hemagglutinin-related protein [Photorhabdus temperata subsp. temperata M1021]
MIEAKNKQTNSIIIQADLSAKDIQSVVARTWGKPTANNINTLFFQNSKGQIVRYDRPNIRNK